MVFGGVLELKLAPSWVQVGFKMVKISKNIDFFRVPMSTSFLDGFLLRKKVEIQSPRTLKIIDFSLVFQYFFDFRDF